MVLLCSQRYQSEPCQLWQLELYLKVIYLNSMVQGDCTLLDLISACVEPLEEKRRGVTCTLEAE